MSEIPQFPQQQFPPRPFPPQQFTPMPAPQAQPPKRRRWPWVLGGLAVLVATSAISANVASASAAKGTATLTATKTVVVTAPGKTVTVQAAPVTSVVTKVVTKVVTVTPSPTTPPGPATTIDANGVYVIGQDMAAGTWHTTGGSECYYARLSSTDTEDILDNNNFSGPATVTIGSSTKAFEIDGGCTWAKE